MIVIKKPIITEKTIGLYQSHNKATFEVVLNATSTQAKKAVEKLYGVTVEKAWTHTRLGKMRTNRQTRKSSRSGSKKIMIFKLKKGNKIDIFEQ